ncbi:hypothetical protein BH23BAC1_BH23BAC1_37540 [soil metagenome]
MHFKISLKQKLIMIIMVIMSFVVSVASAQLIGNEWIDFNQTYFKIPTAEDGIYRLSYNDLLSSGFPVNTVDPRRIQLFHRGKEQAIFIQGQEDAQINPGDFIEFYGQKNDGTSDAELYNPSSAQPHQYYSLFSDTTAYFLTWRLTSTPGKRMSSFIEANVGGLPAEPYHLDHKLLVLASDYAPGRVYPEGTNEETVLSQFDFGEGWTGPRIRKEQSADYTLVGINRIFTAGTKPVLEILLTGRNNRPHNVAIQVGSSLSALRNLTDVTFNYYNNHLVQREVEWSDISGNGDLVVRVLVNGFPDVEADFASVSYIKVTYPQQTDFGGSNRKFFEITPKSSGKSYVEFQNAPPSTTIYDITDKDNVRIIRANTSAGRLLAIVPDTFQGRKLFLKNVESKVPQIKRVRFRKINPASHNYLIVSNRLLMRQAGPDPNPVKTYGAYRASAAGGSYDTIIVEMQQLYDQFSYGEPLPLAIRKFARYMLNGGNPQFLFLVGKGLHVGHNYYRRDLSTYDFRDFVPTIGFPGSDIPFTSGLAGTQYEPAIPTGRLTAKSPEEVKAYLNKVIEMEARPFDDLRRKNLIHLSGGVTAGELVLFRQFVNDFKRKAEDHHLGGKVTTVSKTTNNSVELININEEVNQGVSLITFFGHSSPTIIDIEIGYVSNDAMGYRNKGKYPMLLVNGCNAGNIFSSTLTFGEDWVVTPDRGALGVIAHSAFGYVGPLKRYSDAFYSTGYIDSTYINKSIGEIHKETSRRYIAQVTPTPVHISQVEQMVLQGDPAVALFGADKPDYAIQDNNLFLQPFEGMPITALADSFAIGVIVKNFGRTDYDSLSVEVKRTLSDGRMESYDPVYFPSVKYQDTLYYTIRSKDITTFGNNRFEVTIDYNDEIPELNENNNRAVLNYFIPLSGITNLLPVNYSIVNTTNPVLIAQSTDLLSKNREYIIEIDTAYTFTSSFKKQNLVTAQSLPAWETNLLTGAGADSVVYYWRSKFAQPEAGEDTSWVLSSFIFINNGPEGWSQAAFPQFYEDTKRGLVQEVTTRRWRFDEPENTVKVRTFGENHPVKKFGDVELIINGIPIIFSGRLCSDNSLNGVAFSQSSAAAYLVLNHRSCGRLPLIINNFAKVEIEGGSRLLNSFIETVPTGDYVLLFSIGRVTYESWPLDVKQQMKNIGASDQVLNALKNGEPYIILGKKGGAPGTAIEVVGNAALEAGLIEQEIVLEENIKGKFSQGNVLSTKIGPAKSWGSFLNRAVTDEADVLFYDIFGIDYDGNEILVQNGIVGNELSLTTIDPVRYPYLRLRANMSDQVNFTPAQLKKWQVLYEGVPEGVLTLNGDPDQPLKNLQKKEGAQFEVGFNFKNISDKDFTDSLLVRYTLFNKTRRQSEVNDFKLPPLKAGEGKDFAIAINTWNRVGVNNLNVYANPQIVPEQYYNNNIIDLPDYFEVLTDNINPILDVAFDGVYIMDGDIVSPNPLISIKVKDDNPYLLKQDTTGVDILLKRSCESCMFEKVNFTDANLKWQEATENSDFQVEYQPKELEDGMYTLKVQAVDASGNKSGLMPFSINFEVINKSEITNFYPYPNPFSTNTRFVFTLTGSEIPQEIKIQIMTVTGKIVREITQDELGPIRIGNNISQYAWNGRDEYGDQLANGVYLYKVIIRNNGQGMDQRATAADKGFKKGFGKLYLLR